MPHRAPTDDEPMSAIFRPEVRDPIGRGRYIAVEATLAMFALLAFAGAETVFAASLRWAGASYGVVATALVLAAIPLLIEVVAFCRALRRRLLPSPVDLLYKRYGIRRRTLPNFKFTRS